jgi:hypothetical protein
MLGGVHTPAPPAPLDEEDCAELVVPEEVVLVEVVVPPLPPRPSL